MVVVAQRVLVMLQEIAKSPDGIGVRELARNLGQSPSNIQKGLQALLAQEFVCQDGESKRYLLGPAAMQVGLAALSRFDLRNIGREYLESLAEDTGETAYLGVRYGDEAMYIEKVLGPSEVRVDAPIGARRPFNCTAMGKVLLAYMPEQEFYRLAGAGAFIQRTPSSIADPIALKEEIRRVRESGAAFDREEYSVGVACVAAPVFNHDGKLAGAVVLSGPAPRITSNQNIAQQVKSCAQTISTRLGWQP